MIATESKLWKILKREVSYHRRTRYTRIETGMIVEGVSDVEYVHGPWHGWIELKVGRSIPRANKPIRLRTEFSIAQLAWLIQHHDTKCHLRSWLLIGFAGSTRWHSFLLLPPSVAVKLAVGRAPVSNEVVLTSAGAVYGTRIQDIVQRIGKERV